MGHPRYTPEMRAAIVNVVNKGKQDMLSWKDIYLLARRAGYKHQDDCGGCGVTHNMCDALQQFCKRGEKMGTFTSRLNDRGEAIKHGRETMEILRNAYEGELINNLSACYDRYINPELGHKRYTAEVDEKVAADLSEVFHHEISVDCIRNYRISRDLVGYIKGGKLKKRHKKFNHQLFSPKCVCTPTHPIHNGEFSPANELPPHQHSVRVLPPAAESTEYPDNLEGLARELLDAEKRVKEIKARMLKKLSS